MSKKTKSDFVLNGEYMGKISHNFGTRNVFLLPAASDVSKKIYTAYALACMLHKDVKCRINEKKSINVSYVGNPEQFLERALKRIGYEK